MAYNVSEKFREILYSGDARYNCRLYINGEIIPEEQISSIEISSPIIDTTSDTGSVFHIGTFISQKIEINFRNLDGLELENNPEIYLEIGLLTDEENDIYEYVPIGYFLIDKLEENYQTTCKITCLDYASKFRSNIDITQFFENDQIRAADLFTRICEYYGVEVGTIPNVNNNKIIKFYDSNLSGKDYISYLAELFGGNAKIDRDGKCSIIPLKNNVNIEVDALTSKSLAIGDTYILNRVCFDDGKLKFEAGKNVITVYTLPTGDIKENSYYYLTTDGKYYKYNNEENTWSIAEDFHNTLYLRTDNIFINNQEEVMNIYSAVSGFEATDLECENRIDFSIDCWDIITMSTDKGIYKTFYDNTFKFNGICMGKVSVNIPLKAVEERSNIYNNSIKTKINTIRNTIDQQEGKITTIATQVTEANNKVSEVSQTVDELNSKISDIADITVSRETMLAEVEFDGINESEPISIKIHPVNTNISYLYPRNNLYPSNNLFSTTRCLRFINTSLQEDDPNRIVDYILPMNLLVAENGIYDEFFLGYDTKTCQVIKRCKYNADGTVYVTGQEEIFTFEYPQILLKDGNYSIELLGYTDGYMNIRLMASNIYTTQFATRAEVSSQIRQTAEEINIEVRKKVNDTEVVSTINQSAEEIQLIGNRLVVEADNFKLDKDGSMTCSDAHVTGGDITLVGQERTPKIIVKRENIEELQSRISPHALTSARGENTITISSVFGYGMLAINTDEITTAIISGDLDDPHISLQTRDGIVFLADKTGVVTPKVIQTSLASEKKNFEKLENALDIINKIDIYKYNLKNEEEGTKKHLGFVIGDNYNYSKEVTSNENSGVDNYSFTSLCCQAIKEQQEIIKDLQKRIEKLENK